MTSGRVVTPLIKSQSNTRQFTSDRGTTNSANDSVKIETNSGPPSSLVLASPPAAPSRPSSLYRGVKSLSRWLSKRHRHKKQTIPVPQLDPLSPISPVTPLEGETNRSHAIQSIASSAHISPIRNRSRSSHIQLLDDTWEDWQERYRKGSQNLSGVCRPTCFNGFGHMTAPLHRNESSRLKAVDRLGSAELWNHQHEWLNQELRQLLTKYRLKSATVSLLERTTQQIMFEIGLGYRFSTIGRELSIDAHTVLSADYFALLDASNDWRTRLNPLVHGPPFIKFYLGVPIIFRNIPIGSLAILDPYLKTRVSPELVAQLKTIAEQLVVRLEAELESRQSWRSPKWKETCTNDTGLPLEESLVSQSAVASSSLSVVAADHSDTSSYTSSKLSHGSTSMFNGSQESLIIPFASHKARLHPLPSSRLVLQPFEIFESLLKCPTIFHAIKKACRIVMQNVGANVVYMAEVRVTQRAQIDARFVEQCNGKLVEEIERTTSIQRLAPDEVRARLVGTCKPNIDVKIDDQHVQNDLPLLEATIPSEYGLKFAPYGDPTPGPEPSTELMAGVMVPLRRSEPRYKQSDANAGEIQSGGFVMGTFVTKCHEFSPGDCAFIKKVTRALENILDCYDEIKADGG